MHYYQFNIGDYSGHTSRLSPIEDLAYRRMLDLYYLTERPFNGTSTDVAREVGLLDYQVEVDYVLTKYFTGSGEIWVNERADKEILAYQSKRKLASKAGKASGKARQAKASEQTFNECSTDVQPNNKHKTVNSKQETVTNKNNGRMKRPTLDELILEFDGRAMNNFEEAQKFLNHYESNGWKVGRNPMKSWKHSVTSWISRGNLNGKGNGDTKSKTDLADDAVRNALDRISAQRG